MESYTTIKKYFLKKENRFKLAALLVLLLTMPAAIVLVQQAIRFFTGAAPTSANVYILPATVSISGDQTFQVMVDPKGNPVGFASLDVTFDRSKVELSNDPVSSGILATTIDLSSASTANASGVINADMGLKFDHTAPTQAFELFRFTIRPTSGAGSDVQTVLGLANLQIVDKNTEQDMDLTVTNSNVTLNPTSATASPTSGTVNLNFGGLTSTINQNDNFGFNLNLNTNGFAVVGTDLVINYDPSKVNINLVNKAIFNKFVNESINNQSGQYKVSLLMDTNVDPLNGSAMILTFNAKAVGSGTSQITVSPETVFGGTGTPGQNLSFTANPLTVNINPGPSTTATATATSTATATASSTSSPTSTASGTPTNFRPEDIDMDGDVDIQDYTLLFTYYGQTNPSLARADINRDGRVNVRDYALLYQAFE